MHASHATHAGTHTCTHTGTHTPARTRPLTQVVSSFKYVLPQSRPLGLRLAGCFAIVALERCANLAVPLLYKHMVDTLAEVRARTRCELLVAVHAGQGVRTHVVVCMLAV